MVYTEEQGHAQMDDIQCAEENAEEITIEEGAAQSVAEAQKACKDALKDVYAAMASMHNSRW